MCGFDTGDKTAIAFSDRGEAGGVKNGVQLFEKGMVIDCHDIGCLYGLLRRES